MSLHPKMKMGRMPLTAWTQSLWREGGDGRGGSRAWAGGGSSCDGTDGGGDGGGELHVLLPRDEAPRLLGQGRLQGRAHFMLSSALPTPLPLPPRSAPSALASVFCTSLRVSKP